MVVTAKRGQILNGVFAPLSHRPEVTQLTEKITISMTNYCAVHVNCYISEYKKFKPTYLLASTDNETRQGIAQEFPLVSNHPALRPKGTTAPLTTPKRIRRTPGPPKPAH